MPITSIIYLQVSWCMACSKCIVFTIALTLRAEFNAQYGVIISVLLSHASTLKYLHNSY